MKTGLLSLILCIFLLSCETEVVPPPPPPDPVPTIGLIVEDTGVTEMWLRVSMSQTAWERGFTLVRDGVPIDTAILLTADSVFVDEGILPNQQYTYQAFRISDSEILDSTDKVQATTMDTTSHEFTWEMFEFGDHSSSVLYDVAIIDENNIWAVGEIYLNDSTGQGDPDSYNVMRWDGSSWEILRLGFPICDANGNEQGTSSITGTAIFVFSESDIWISSGGSLLHWDGRQYERICMSIGYQKRNITTLWGTDGDLYWGGTNGYLAYNGGSGWQQVATGTTLDINDIYGAVDTQTSETEILAVAAQPFVSADRRILRIAGATVETVSDSGIPWSLRTTWFKTDRRYFVAGDGTYSKRSLQTVEPWTEADLSRYYLYKMRGSDINDVVASGSFGEVLHFNGVSWRSFHSVVGLSAGWYYSVAISGNLVVAVGSDGSRAIIAQGIRAP